MSSETKSKEVNVSKLVFACEVLKSACKQYEAMVDVLSRNNENLNKALMDYLSLPECDKRLVLLLNEHGVFSKKDVMNERT